MFTWENSHRREFHTEITFWFRIAFTWWLGHFISRYLKVHFMLIKYTCDSKSQTLRMRYPFQSTGRPISHRNGWSFHIYMIPFRDFVPEWNSRSSTTTGVNSRRGDPRRHDIFWWYHVKKYRAMSRLSCSDRASGKVSRSTCFARMDLNHIINSRGKKNDWHMLSRERREISFTVLLVNCHDVNGRILDRRILRQTVMEEL